MEEFAVSHLTTLVTSQERLEEFLLTANEHLLLAFDVEGVCLSRTGQATLIAIGIHDRERVRVFLFDLLDETTEFFTKQMSILKCYLEDASVIKIVHDCRQDSDSLNEFFNIRVAGVFDTSIYNMLITGSAARDNLNHTLANYGCEINRGRNKPQNFYLENPTYWGSRPLSADQMTCASADVSSLFELREKLLHNLPPGSIEVMQKASENALDEYRSLRYLEDVVVPKEKMGRVIGVGGSGIEKIRSSTGAIVSTCGGGFRIMAKDKCSIENAKKMITTKLCVQKYIRK